MSGNTFQTLRAAGVSYTWDNGKLRYKAPTQRLTPGVLAALHNAKQFHALSDPDAPGWGQVPPADLPPRSGLPRLEVEQEELLFAHVLRQPETVIRWALDRSAIYEAAQPDITLRAAHLAAALDVIQWQRPDLQTAAAIVADLQSVEAAHNHFAGNDPGTSPTINTTMEETKCEA